MRVHEPRALGPMQGNPHICIASLRKIVGRCVEVYPLVDNRHAQYGLNTFVFLRQPDCLSVDRVLIIAVTADHAQIVTHAGHEESPSGRARH